MYETILRGLRVTLPFYCFTTDVLMTPGVAPSQLLPNGWAAMQAFKVIFRALTLIPSALLFLSHYTTRAGQSAGWVSLAPLPKGSLFNAYAASYKGFKNQFVMIQAIGEASFTLDSKPLPLYWRLPSKFKGFFKGQLTLEDKANLQLLEELPRGMSCKELVAITFEYQPTQNLKSNTMDATTVVVKKEVATKEAAAEEGQARTSSIP
ncbi:hypothetical protein CR513_56942, partial [Mucuna pruriens]